MVGKQVEKPIEDLRRGLRCTLPESLAETIGSGLRQETSGVRLRPPRRGRRGEGSAKDAQVVVVNLVAKAGIAGLVETLELVKADGVAVRHEQPMKDDGKTRLTEGFDLARFTENFAARRNQ